MSKMHPSLEGFRDWLRTKPPTERYRYTNDRVCAISQYYQSLGLRYTFRVSNTPSNFDMGDIGSIAARDEPWTFGAAAERLQEAFGRYA